MKKFVAISALLALIITSCAGSNRQGKHHSHHKAKRQASGYFFGFQH